MNNIGDGIGLVFLLAAISLPLGLWKLGEIIIYVCSHIHWSNG